MARSRENDNGSYEMVINRPIVIPSKNETVSKSTKLRTILSIDGLADWWDVSEGTKLFTDLRCPVSTCRLTKNRHEKDIADMILYQHEPKRRYLASSPEQVQAIFQWDSPKHFGHFQHPGNSFC